MKKIISLLLLILLLVSATCSVFAAQGQNLTGIYDLEIEEAFKGKITITPKDVNGTPVSESSLNSKSFYPNAVRFDLSFNDASNGYFYLLLTLSGSGTEPTSDNIVYIDQLTASSSLITYNHYQKSLVANEEYAVYISSNDGTALTKIAEYRYKSLLNLGDVDGDGTVSTTDAMEILYAVAGLVDFSPEQKERADVDQDSVITVVDALKVLQYSTGEINKF